MNVDSLRWRTVVYVAGTQFVVLEEYEAVHARMRDSAFRIEEEGMEFAPPIELTAKSDTGGPLRIAVAGAALTAVIELPEEYQGEVAE